MDIFVRIKVRLPTHSVCVCVCACVRACVRVCVCVCACLRCCVHMCVGVYVHVCVCMCGCVRTCMCVYVCMFTCVRASRSNTNTNHRPNATCQMCEVANILSPPPPPPPTPLLPPPPSKHLSVDFAAQARPFSSSAWSTVVTTWTHTSQIPSSLQTIAAIFANTLTHGLLS